MMTTRELGFVSLLFFLTSAVHAADMSFRGTLIEPPPCTINNGDIITEFGEDLMTTRIDGAQYRKEIEYNISCTSQSNNSMTLSIVGTEAPFGAGYLRTDYSYLGIKISTSLREFPINTQSNFNYPDWPKLYATPVKWPGAALQGRSFRATAVMQVSYR